MGDFEYLPYEEQEQSQLSESEIEPTPSGSLSDVKDISGRGTRLLRLGVIGAALIVGVIIGLVLGLLLDRENSEIQATNPTNHSVYRASASSTLPPIDLELLPKNLSAWVLKVSTVHQTQLPHQPQIAILLDRIVHLSWLSHR